MTIDAHQHFWSYSAEEYGWISDDISSLRRDFLPAELKETIATHHVEGVVAVQARQTLEETRWLLALAREHAWIRGVVGWVPLQDESIAAIFDELSTPLLKGVRHVVQGEPDPEFLARPAFNRGIAEATRRGLVYDILVYAQQLPQVIAFVDRHPQQVFVVDHAAKPAVGPSLDENWRRNLKELGRRENVSCKFSGLASEAKAGFTGAVQLQPLFNSVVESFGPKRILFGSDWPVCLAATTYLDWLAALKSCAAEFSEVERADFFGANAVRIYRLS